MSSILLLQTDWTLFIGRFHPLFVHLPIGFLLLAGILELVNRKQQKPGWDSAISLSLIVGAISGFVAAFCGWMLAADGGYDAGTLGWHRWLGIGTSVLALVAWLMKSKRISFDPKYFAGVLGATILGLTITGHLGGNLTHGEDYLYQYAPGLVQTIMGVQPDSLNTRQFASPDSVIVYADLIKPVLEKKCISCHSDTKTQGGLNMATYSLLLEGGEHGSVIEPEAPLSSEIVRRVTIDPSSVKYMPTKGTPLTFTEINLLSWWIDIGADSSQRLTEVEVPESIKALLLRDYKLDTRPKPYVETANTKPLAEATRTALEEAGFSVQMLASNSNFVEVGPKVVRSEVSSEQVKSLLEAKDQITWINFGEAGLKDSDLEVIGQLPQLTRLRVEKNKITDAGVAHLKGLTHLESLNLYGTEVTDASVDVIAGLPALKKVYLWQSQISQEGVEALRSKRPDLMIDTGFQFAQQTTEEAEEEEESGE
ncbi:DUF2231 domain-containing protein [Flavilitoribacter nigricans]|uniref:Uncharacterized protein n=1 Tax=Flavilitoribacter nigricans (strain ATCC 23147 / DSM 23189 / NBRC 102662 / NCIMB 1420 / SS-2) TaxID=1122177 RepID=A0A2D0NJF1_FLAN2|nr:DUF2231 domain-containing protein [Flavilitoribacter nigricans]PHN08520.1 hypothetical protein CRP01_01000 [Flavilitoribacter nigricans DSM 23189 = NBRC 102662]